MEIKIKRIYEEPDKKDGMRILIDKLWPRGMAKENADIDLWLKDIAPSSDLRKWFGHDPKKWTEFCKRYYKELALNQEPVKHLLDIVKKHKIITLLYAAKDEEFNNAIRYLEHLIL